MPSCKNFNYQFALWKIQTLAKDWCQVWEGLERKGLLILVWAQSCKMFFICQNQQLFWKDLHNAKKRRKRNQKRKLTNTIVDCIIFFVLSVRDNAVWQGICLKTAYEKLFLRPYTSPFIIVFRYRTFTLLLNKSLRFLLDFLAMRFSF